MPEIVLQEVPLKDGLTDQNALQTALAEDVACVAVAGPNFLGQLEPMQALCDATHQAGALFVAVVNPLSLGVLQTPGEYGADFAVAEGQSLGNAMHFGGPGLGIFTCKQAYVRQVPGRIVGIAKDKNGNRSFVLTLQAREQHIRRERAASNICSNEALCALNAVIYLTLLGPEGIKEVASLNLSRAHEFKEMLVKNGHKIKFAGPFYNEFVVEVNTSAQEVIEKLETQGIAAGYDLGQVCENLKNCLLVCVTETKSVEDLQKYAQALRGF